ncbi:hypothetical protein HYPSUDRAFT_215875 [Hypholoma sublateritium FD-334 SS-4]|uniref:Uncharacterized protein n=1 Tax=Hypholoma sublateritium (strain FD-334 SS-4) TaxID=945553 RepID=A0A0D2P0P4_HYPSF|nr:hypothetical protein HYPSUDRAFT_215875 [Hypholoma sublateritium FD-334 SS-4]
MSSIPSNRTPRKHATQSPPPPTNPPKRRATAEAAKTDPRSAGRSGELPQLKFIGVDPAVIGIVVFRTKGEFIKDVVDRKLNFDTPQARSFPDIDVHMVIYKE